VRVFGGGPDVAIFGVPILIGLIFRPLLVPAERVLVACGDA